MELVIWYLIYPFTWGQLEIIVRGLRIWVLEGTRYRGVGFEVGDSKSVDGYPWVGWGDVAVVKRAAA